MKTEKAQCRALIGSLVAAAIEADLEEWAHAVELPGFSLPHLCEQAAVIVPSSVRFVLSDRLGRPVSDADVAECWLAAQLGGFLESTYGLTLPAAVVVWLDSLVLGLPTGIPATDLPEHLMGAVCLIAGGFAQTGGLGAWLEFCIREAL